MDEQVKYTEDFERGRLFGREQILEIMDLQGFGGRKVVIEMDRLRKEVSEVEGRRAAAEKLAQAVEQSKNFLDDEVIIALGDWKEAAGK